MARNYIGIAEQGSDAWWISFPAFPGVTSAGNTLAGLLRNGLDALSLAVDAMQEDGIALPPVMEDDPDATGFDRSGYRDPVVVIVPVEVGGQAARIDVTLDESLVAQLDDLGARTNTTRSDLLVRGVRMVLAGEA